MSRWKKQTVNHDTENGQYGNCMQACIASLLNLPMEQVPHFHEDGCDRPTLWTRVEKFVREHGFALQYGRSYDCLGLADGPCSRGYTHLVLIKGDKMVHDPHPSRAGLLRYEGWYHLIPIDPGKRK